MRLLLLLLERHSFGQFLPPTPHAHAHPGEQIAILSSTNRVDHHRGIHFYTSRGSTTMIRRLVYSSLIAMSVFVRFVFSQVRHDVVTTLPCSTIYHSFSSQGDACLCANTPQPTIDPLNVSPTVILIQFKCACSQNASECCDTNVTVQAHYNELGGDVNALFVPLVCVFLTCCRLCRQESSTS